MSENAAHRPFADAHNDLLLDLALASDPGKRFAADWLPEFQRGGVRLQVCPAGVHTPSADPHADGLAQVRAVHTVAAHPDAAAQLVRTSADLETLAAPGETIGLLPAFEGLEPLGDDPERLHEFAALGVRVASLTHNFENAFAGGCETTVGLKDAGRAVLAEMAAAGVALDLAHASDATFDAALAAWDGPVLHTHACCRAIEDVPRNTTDDQIRAIAERDGLVCLTGVPPLLTGGDADLDDFLRHIDHVVELIGVDRVGIGMDFIVRLIELGVQEPPPGEQLALEAVAGPHAMPALLAGLEAHGYDEAAVRGIAWDNLVGFLTRVLAGKPMSAANVLLVLDAQRNMLEPPTAVPDAPAITDALTRLLERARACHVRVVFVRNCGREGDPDVPGTPGWELVHHPRRGEAIVNKWSPDAFAETTLAESIAPGARITLAGMQSELCIEETARTALARGHAVCLAQGAHSTYEGDRPAATISADVERRLADAGVDLIPAERCFALAGDALADQHASR